MILPTPPSLVTDQHRKEQSGQERSVSEAASTNDDPAQNMEVDGTTSKTEAENGSNESNNISNTGEDTDTFSNEIHKVKKDDIIAQVSFGTLLIFCFIISLLIIIQWNPTNMVTNGSKKFGRINGCLHSHLFIYFFKKMNGCFARLG